MLTAGAAIGLSFLRIAHATGSIPLTSAYVVYGFYFAFSGIAISALPLLVRDRIIHGVAWGIGAHYLFACGCTAALFVPMIVTKWSLGNSQFEPCTPMLDYW